MRISLFFVVLSVLPAATASMACSGTTTGTTSGTSGSTAVSVTDCSSRCQTKATQCGEPAADAMTSCSSLCSSTTEGQLSCLEGKPCSALTPSGASGFCAGTTQQCMGSLKCVYGTGSGGTSHCYGASCCDKTSACDSDPSLLKSCTAGSCKSTAIGYYCGR